jgi:hypothetical protein
VETQALYSSQVMMPRDSFESCQLDPSNKENAPETVKKGLPGKDRSICASAVLSRPVSPFSLGQKGLYLARV